MNHPFPPKESEPSQRDVKKQKTFVGIYMVLGLLVWWLIYGKLADLSSWLVDGVCRLEKGSHLAAALRFFVYETPKVFMLLIMVVFFVGIIRTIFTPERTRQILAGKREWIGNVLASGLGVVTPFCSCSAVPLFIGMMTSGVPLGVTFSFLISAPMVNEVALVMLFGLFGWKITAVYLAMGLCIAIGAGWVLGLLKLEKGVEPWVYEVPVVSDGDAVSLDWMCRVGRGWDAVKEIVGRVWIYIVLGIAVGAGIHGYVPENFMVAMMGKKAWWSVPVAVLLGVPMYGNAAGILPVVQALLGKGAALGTVLAFMMSVIGLSLPEAIILRQVLKLRLIITFFAVVACGILAVGFVFNAVF